MFFLIDAFIVSTYRNNRGKENNEIHIKDHIYSMLGVPLHRVR